MCKQGKICANTQSTNVSQIAKDKVHKRSNPARREWSLPKGQEAMFFDRLLKDWLYHRLNCWWWGHKTSLTSSNLHLLPSVEVNSVTWEKMYWDARLCSPLKRWHQILRLDSTLILYRYIATKSSLASNQKFKRSSKCTDKYILCSIYEHIRWVCTSNALDYNCRDCLHKAGGNMQIKT